MENSIEEDIEILVAFNLAPSLKHISEDEFKDVQKAIKHILSDYKRVLKENELLRKDIEGWEKYCEEIREEQTEMSNKNYELEFKVEKLQKENEELRKKLNEENKRCMMLAIEKQDYFEKYRYHLQQNESLTKEFSNVILVQKIKDKIIHYQELQDNYIKKYDEINEGLQAMINALQELIEEREEKIK